MVAAYLRPHGGVELRGGDVGEVDALHVDQVLAKDVEHVASLSRIAGLQAANAGIGCLDLEGIDGSAVVGLHSDFVFQVAVEGRELEAVVLAGHLHDDAVVGVEHGVEPHLLVVDEYALGVLQVAAQDDDGGVRSRRSEEAVGLCGVGDAHASDFGCAAAIVVGTAAESCGKAAAYEKSNEDGLDILNHGFLLYCSSNWYSTGSSRKKWFCSTSLSG